MSSNVSAVSKNAVLNVFPINSPYRIDAAGDRTMHSVDRTKDARTVANKFFAADERGFAGFAKLLTAEIAEKDYRGRRESDRG